MQQGDPPTERSTDHFRALIEQFPGSVLVVAGGRLRFANPRGLALLGADGLDELDSVEPWAFAPQTDRPELAERHARLLAGVENEVRAEDVLLTVGGRSVDVETVSTASEVDGEPVVLVVAHIRQDPDTAEALATAEQRFTEAFRLAPTGMLLLDQGGTVLAANGAAAVLARLDPGDVIGRSFLRLLHPEDRTLVRSWLHSLVGGAAKAVSGERRILQPDGDDVWAHTSLALLPGDPPTFVVHLMDITGRRETEARLAYQALHDSLTGLPNRTLLFDRLAQAVRAALRGEPEVTVLYIDIDNFKTINDTRGHSVGDRVLVEIAGRLSRILRPADTVARLGGDEFAIVAEGLPEDAARDLAARVTDAITRPVELGTGELLPVTASVGLAHSAQTPLDVDALLNAADAAMYRAKHDTRGQSSEG